MKKLLVINAVNNKDKSKTYFVYKDVISKLDLTGFEIKELNLIEMNLPFLDTSILHSKNHHEYKRKIDIHVEELAMEFCTSNAYIFIFPTWNLNVPATLKAYIDIICDAGKVFNYTAHGSVGMLDYRKVILINTCGGLSRGAIDYMLHMSKFMHLDSKEIFVPVTSINFKGKDDLLKDYVVNKDFFH